MEDHQADGTPLLNDMVPALFIRIRRTAITLRAAFRDHDLAFEEIGSQKALVGVRDDRLASIFVLVQTGALVRANWVTAAATEELLWSKFDFLVQLVLVDELKVGCKATKDLGVIDVVRYRRSLNAVQFEMQRHASFNCAIDSSSKRILYARCHKGTTDRQRGVRTRG